LFDIKALKTLVERESCWLREKAESFNRKKFIIFPAGLTAQRFYYTLLNDFGIEADFFVDNNPAFAGKAVCGKPVLSFVHAFSENSGGTAVLIPTCRKYYEQIAAQLSDAGIQSYMHADTFTTCRLYDRYAAVAEMLVDSESKRSYWGAVYSMLTGDNSFVSYKCNQYFALREFAASSLETIVDAGAYVGDTVEEYVKRGQESIKIYAFEPYEAARLKMEARVERLKTEWLIGDNDIEIIPAGVGVKTGIQSFQMYGASTSLSSVNSGGFELPIYSLDDFFKDREPFSLLKADIEGGEMDLLKGAENMIRTYKPKMALCIYHSPLDFAQIAEYVRELVPEYRIYVRSHNNDYRDTVSYCLT